MSNVPLWLYFVAFLAVLGPLVFVHEYGHYIVGRWCGVKADAFSIGFGRKIFGWTDKRGTEWRICWLPLGGYVQFAGDRDAVSQPDANWQAMPAAERSHSFPAQPVWKRALIVLAGPVTNFLFAIAILAAFAMAYGQSQTPAVVGQVDPGRPAATAGLQAGDRILEIGGRSMRVFDDIQMAIAFDLGQPVNLLVERGNERFGLTVTPDIIKETDRFGNKSERAILGIRSGKLVYTPVGPIAAIGHGVDQTVGIVRMTASVLVQFVTGDRSIKDMSGPVKIAKTSGEVASLGIEQLIFFAAFISINLGFINLLPLPMLDGGHLLFYGYEAVRRRPAPPQAQEWAFRFGFAAIVTLMLVVTFNDLGSIGVWDGIARLIG
ncbi:RIP metalloprotease RseP [Sphingopyxis witflariensis]|uniref:Zinc metalloprotease n=1 Tax=Sphingopyxis witflariensis TaxID=173675 RepID=A0A246JQX3_9SPHN|nr:RIP metalloprotease RseP [Sphingopyxis witflariensis]OWQ95414.1 RIP metalloprotease RseP [Sphingopyxis witflariensis]